MKLCYNNLMSTIQVQTELPIDDLLNSLHQLSVDDLVRLAEKAATVKAKSQQIAQQQYLLQALRAQKTELWSDEQRAAYQQLIVAVKNFSSDQPRQLGLFSQLVKIHDDFDAPFSKTDIALFWGSLSDEFGLSRSQDFGQDLETS